MANWTDLDTSALLPGEPLTSAIALAFEENPRAIAEGSATAPRIDPIAAMAHEGVAGAVGTYAFLATTNASNAGVDNFGETRAGSQLHPAGFASDGVRWSDENAAETGAPAPAASLSGTWRCMGRSPAVSGSSTTRRSGATIWLRIA